MTMNSTGVREPSVVEFDRLEPLQRETTRHWYARTQNCIVEWVAAEKTGASFSTAGLDETMVLLPETGVSIHWEGEDFQAQPRSFCVIPSGPFRIDFAEPGEAICLYSRPIRDLTRLCVNNESYRHPDPRIELVRPMSRVRSARRVGVYPVDEVPTLAHNARARMFQSATMSINWVEYEGPRNPTALSPHSHATFEQASLIIKGKFTHHMRTPWGRNSHQWRPDRHEITGPRSIAVFPVGLIHTVAGIGPGHHMMMDIFAPPRADYVARGFVTNAGDYTSQS